LAQPHVEHVGQGHRNEAGAQFTGQGAGDKRLAAPGRTVMAKSGASPSARVASSSARSGAPRAISARAATTRGRGSCGLDPISR
jgi:hypothetical protein